MRKFLKVLVSMTMVAGIFFAIPIESVSANNQESEYTETPYVLKLLDRTLFFDSQSDLDVYKEYMYLGDMGIQLYNDVVTKDYILSSWSPRNGWIGKIFGSWSNVSSYTIGSDVTYSATLNSTYSSVGFSVTASYRYGASKTIPADSSRRSDLGIWQTYRVEKHKTDIYTGYGTVFQQSIYYNSVTKSGTPIINPCYEYGSYQCGYQYPL